MVVSFTRMGIIQRVSDHFTRQGFDCDVYSDKLGAVRIPLYCLKQNGSVQEEVVVDVIAEETVSKETYLPDIEEQGATIKDACSTRFFQFYFPHAKVFWAFGHSVVRGKKFDEFRGACERVGIGLIEVLVDAVKVELEAKPLTESILDHVRKETCEFLPAKQRAKVVDGLADVIDGLHEDYLHYLVYYAVPEFQRRAITSRETQDLSMRLMNQLLSVKHLAYAPELVELSERYINECKQDQDIAYEKTRELWKTRLNLPYPDIHKDFEPVLLHESWYRDHFLHQFQVFLLGTLILDRYYNDSFIQKFENDNNTKIEDAWLATSTYHDFNYSIEMSEGWLTDFLKRTLNIDGPQNEGKLIVLDLERTVVRNEFIRKMNGLCDALGCTLDDTVMRFVLERAACDKNHAVLGALTFLNKFEKSTALSEKAIYKSAASIMLHDSKIWQCFCGRAKEGCQQWEQALSDKKLIRNLEFSSSPLAFLLAFCDSAQEWGREGRGHDTAKAELEDVRFDKKKTIVEISFCNDSSCDKVRKEIQDLKHFLKDKRFGMILHSMEGTKTEIWMTGQ